MKYAVIKVVNGSFSVASEWADDLHGAIGNFHAVCQTLWNEKTVEKATVKIVDENLTAIPGYADYIKHN